MSIPRFDKEMEIIQKLDDLPNSVDGLDADGLKAKFDEAGRLIKDYLNGTLIPALVAKQLPFMPTSAIDAQTIQDAIENVQAQVRNASTGTITNGSVTKEKLSENVILRSYGGVPWFGGNPPTAQDNPSQGFPLGQIWFCLGADKEVRVWMQTSEGVWWPMAFDPAPDSDNMFMQYIGGNKVWTDKETAIANLGSLRIETGKYVGDGEVRTETLTVTPKILVIHSEEGAVEDDKDDFYWDNPVTLASGAMATSPHLYGSSVKLVDNALHFYIKGNEYATATEYLNRKDVTYTWTAIY